MTDPEILIDEDDRYARLRLISWWRQDRLDSATVLVVGAGALGNEVVKNLTLVGVGRIVLVDFDSVEPSNLSRSLLFRRDQSGRAKVDAAAEWICDCNPDVRVLPIAGDIRHDVGLGLFAAADVVIGCLDNREARLWVNRQCWKVGTPWIDGGIQEIQGVVKVFRPPESACYECGMTAQDYRLMNLRYSCPLLSHEDLIQGKVPTAPTIASLIGSLQVQEALKLLHGMDVEAGVVHVFNGVGNRMYTTRLPYRDDCLSHETYPEPTGIDLGHTATAGQLFEAARRCGLSGRLSLQLDRDLVTRVVWDQDGTEREVMRPESAVTSAILLDERGRQGRPERVSDVGEDERLADQPLARLGIPAYDIVQVESEDGLHALLLEADAPW